jgi:hypothetical protein
MEPIKFYDCVGVYGKVSNGDVKWCTVWTDQLYGNARLTEKFCPEIEILYTVWDRLMHMTMFGDGKVLRNMKTGYTVWDRLMLITMFGDENILRDMRTGKR